MSINLKDKQQHINNLKELKINNNIIKKNQTSRNELNENFKNNRNTIYSYNYKKANNFFNTEIKEENNLLKEKDKKIEILQEQCLALQQELLEKTNIIKKEKEKQNCEKNNNNNTIISNYKYNFNTSTNFPLKSEIKKLWEEFALISILDNFIDFENEPELIFFFVTEMIIIMEKLINNICKDIYEKVSISLNIPNDKKLLYDIEKTSRPLIKEHLNKIFINTEQKPFINNFIDLYKKSLKDKFEKIKIDYIIDNDDFFMMIKKLKDLLLFTKFNDPPLLFNIEPNINIRKCEKIYINNEINKKKYLIINDNGFQNINGIIILKAPIMKNGFPLNDDIKTIIMVDNNYHNNNIHSNNNKENTIKKTHFKEENKNIPINEINPKNDLIIENKENINNDIFSKDKLDNKNINRNEFTINNNNNKNNNINEDYNKKIKKIDNSLKFNSHSNMKYNNFINNVETYSIQEKENKKEKSNDSQKLKLDEQIINNYYNLNDYLETDINARNENVVSNFSFVSENLNIKNEFNENLEKSGNRNILSSESRIEIKSATNTRNFINYDIISNSYVEAKNSKNNEKIKKINNIKKNKININMNKINNNIKYYKNKLHNKKRSKENFIIFYNQKLPLLLKKKNKELNHLKSKNNENKNTKKISNNKINTKNENFSTEIYNKDLFNGINFMNIDLMIKNKTVKELFNNNKKKDFFNRKNQNKLNVFKQNSQVNEIKFNKNDQILYNKKKNNLKYKSISKIKARENNININRMKNNDIKNILKCILNKKRKKENNNNVMLINRPNYTKIKDRNIRKNINSISGNNILISPKGKKIYTQKYFNNTYVVQNYNDKKTRNEIPTKNSNISYPYIKRSLKNLNNTGYKIKNVNINYFNIIQPNELFINPHSSRSNSKPQIINKNKFIILNNNNSNNLSSLNSNFISDLKLKNLLSKNKKKNKMEINISKNKNSLYLITDYNYSNIKMKKKCNKKISDFNVNKHDGSCSCSSFGNTKFEGNTTINLYKDKNVKQLIKQKMYNKDLKVMNFNGINFNNYIFRNINLNTQASFIKLPKKKNNIKRDISTGRKYISKKLNNKLYNIKNK